MTEGLHHHHQVFDEVF